MHHWISPEGIQRFEQSNHKNECLRQIWSSRSRHLHSHGIYEYLFYFISYLQLIKSKEIK